MSGGLVGEIGLVVAELCSALKQQIVFVVTCFRAESSDPPESVFCERRCQISVKSAIFPNFFSKKTKVAYVGLPHRLLEPA